MATTHKKFFPIFSKNVVFFKKIVNEKIFKTSFSIKKVTFIFVAKCRPLPIKRDLGPRNGFLPFSQKIQFFFEKTENIQYLICDKNSYFNFWRKTPPFPKKLQMCFQNSFSRFSQKILLISKNCRIKKYSVSNF